MVSMIALIRVNNLPNFYHYREQVPATLETYGGEIRFRAEKPMTLGDEALSAISYRSRCFCSQR